MWIVLNGTLRIADIIIGAVVALAGVLGLARLQPVATRYRRPLTLFKLAAVVLIDIVRSNIAVAAIVLRPQRGRVSGFVDIPLEMRHPLALAGLACIITATPGTAWTKYDSIANVVTIHVLDLVDGAALACSIKNRYEAKLREVFE